MPMYQIKKGFTKDSIRAVIKAGNNGTKAMSSADEYNWCAYKSPDGNKCFVGCFIPEGHPGQELQGDVKELLWTFPELADLLPFKYENELIEFQKAHDEGHKDTTYNNLEKFLEHCEEYKE